MLGLLCYSRVYAIYSLGFRALYKIIGTLTAYSVLNVTLNSPLEKGEGILCDLIAFPLVLYTWMYLLSKTKVIRAMGYMSYVIDPIMRTHTPVITEMIVMAMS